ncbi:MAG: hypothetical protein E7014_00425 [Alphaproteobacteria bacterium]|nr:hypothetical protein [Alphaproteobacteria bacterium]
MNTQKPSSYKISFSHNIQDWIYFTVSIIIGLIIGVSQVMLIVLLLQLFITIYIALLCLFPLSFLVLCKEFIINLLKFKLENVLENSIAVIFVAFMVSALYTPIVLLVNENLTLIEDFFANPKSYYNYIFLFIFFSLVLLDSTKNAWIFIIKPALVSNSTHQLPKKPANFQLKKEMFIKQSDKCFFSLFFGSFLIIPLGFFGIILNNFLPNLTNIIQPTISQICFFLLFIFFLLPFQVIRKNPKNKKTVSSEQETTNSQQILTQTKNKEAL